MTNTLIKDLEEITNSLIESKKGQDLLEREYAKVKAEVFLTLLQNKEYSNAESREHATVQSMENDHQALLDALYEARGRSRELALKREVIIEQLKERRANSL